MRRLMLFTAAACGLSACASSSSSSSTPTPTARPATQTVSGGAAGSMTIANTTSSDVVSLASAADAVWRIMPSIYDSLGVTVNTMDQSRKMIGNTGYKIRQRLGKAPLSRYIDCGNSQIGPSADSYDVMLSVMSTVAPAGEKSATVSTIVEAQAKPVTYNQPYMRCSTKGTLEKRLGELLNARLAR